MFLGKNCPSSPEAVNSYIKIKIYIKKRNKHAIKCTVINALEYALINSSEKCLFAIKIRAIKKIISKFPSNK